MHNEHYASGFLYHPPTGKILLQKSKDDTGTSEWCLFSGILGKNDSHEAFARIISDQLGVDIKSESVHPVYDYERPKTRKVHFIYYAVVEQENLRIRPKPGHDAQWFTQKQIQKLPLPEQVRHDIIIGTRVIGAALWEKMQAALSVNKG